MTDKIKNGQYWKGSPAAKSGRVNHPWPDERPARRPYWVAVYGVTSLVLAGLPLLALAAGLAVIGLAVRHTRTWLSQAVLPALLWTPVAALAAFAAYALVTVVAVRVLSIGLREGYHPVRSRVGWQLWATERLMDAARNYLFPLYASLLTPTWLRLLGAKVGRGTEISTVLLTPKFTVVEDGAFLADDTMVASYELGGGWIHVAKTTRQARVPRQLRDHPAGPAGSRRRTGGGAVGHPAQGEARIVVAGQPADAVAQAPHGGRCCAARRPAAAAEDDAGGGGGCRLVPVMVTFAIGVAVLGVLQALARIFGIWLGGAGRRAGAARGGRGGRRRRRRREMACGRPHPPVNTRCGRRSSGATR